MAGPPPIFKTVNCEETFIFASLQEFVKVWSSGHQASFNLNCENGRAWLSLGFQLGTPSSPHHLGVGHPPPTHLHGSVPRSKSLARRVRDRARAARHQKAQATVAQAATSTKFSETNSSLSAAAAPANQSCPPSSTPPVASTGQPDPAQAATACTPGAPPLARARPVPSPPPPTQHLPVLPAGLRPQPS